MNLKNGVNLINYQYSNLTKNDEKEDFIFGQVNFND